MAKKESRLVAVYKDGILRLDADGGFPIEAGVKLAGLICGQVSPGKEDITAWCFASAFIQARKRLRGEDDMTALKGLREWGGIVSTTEIEDEEVDG